MSSSELHQKPPINSNNLSSIICANETTMSFKEKKDPLSEISMRTIELTEDQNKLRTMHSRDMRIRIIVDQERLLCELIHGPLINDYNLKISKIAKQIITFTLTEKGVNKNVEHRFTKSGVYFIGVDNYCRLELGEILPSTKLDIRQLNEKQNVLMKGDTINIGPLSVSET